MYKAPAPIRAIVPQPQEVPPGLEAVVLKCLSKKVDLRYQSMEELVADLEKVERGMVPDAVNEMMGRSGGFNVPADYFRNASRATSPSMVPSSASLPRKTSVFWVAMASISAVALVIVGVVVAASLRAAPKEERDAGVTGDPAASLANNGSDPSAAARRDVVVTPEPESAVVWLGDQALGPGEHVIQVGAQEKVSVRVELAGYQSRNVVVDGTRRAVAVRLEPDAAKAIPVATPNTSSARAGTPKPPTSAKTASAGNGAPPAGATGAAGKTAPTATPAAPQTRPASCSMEDWDPFEKKCKR
jgi:serine/threonine-protein kinase